MAFNRSGESGSIVIIVTIVVLLIVTIFLGQFFKSENKLKLLFDNKQNISFLISTHDDKQKITLATVLIYNSSTGRLAAVNLLPDTYTSFLKNGKTSFYTIAESLNNGVTKEDVKDGVAKLLGLKINYYLFTSEKNFIKIIDIMGGVEVFTQEITLPEENIYYSQGLINLDGDKAVEFTSINVPTEDYYQNLRRSELILRSIINLKPAFKDVFNEHTIPKFIYPLVSSNMTVNDMVIFYKQIAAMYNKGYTDFSRNMVSITLYCDRDLVNNKNIFLPKKSGNWVKSDVVDAVNNIAKAESSYTGNKIRIQLLNGTDIVGFASRTERYLQTFGVKVVESGNASNQNYENTVIISINDDQKANKLAELIKCKKIIKSEVTDDSKYEVTLILGRDFDGRVVK